jgi:hypothetical protein
MTPSRDARPGPAWQLLRLGRASGGRAAGVLSVWVAWERFVSRRQRIRPLRPGAVLRTSDGRHHGPPVTLRDGTVVAPGDPIVELHFDNRRLAELAAAHRPWDLAGRIGADLRLLAEREAGGPPRALHGVTMFAAAGPRFGFEVRPLPRTRRAALERFFMAGLVMLYHPGGWDAVRRQARRWPGELWMSPAALRRRHG